MAARKARVLVQGSWGLNWQITPRALTDALPRRRRSEARVRSNDGNEKVDLAAIEKARRAEAAKFGWDAGIPTQ